jgi:uncharacterized damage-inducible protein DinB
MAGPAGKSQLAETVARDYARYFLHLAERVDRHVRALPQEKFWVKPFAFGNSIGHLVLHLTGNLNHYIGAQIAGTGYVRDREREFTETVHPSPAEALARFHEAVGLVVRTLESLDDAGFCERLAGLPPVETRFGQFLVCVAHLNNHVGQMSYLVQAQGHSTQEPPVW